MLQFKGNSVYEAIAFGTISIFKNQDFSVRRTHVEDTHCEIKRFEDAKQKTIEQLEKIYQKALIEVGETNAQIFEIHND
ncbi:MAG: phosphoenolpyruvate--protein phosphotransferase, partial [Ruminococcaceae bacterium]|nr:phosphoenolpyruvate--protein phosphotransferase [Oscillospiraceae bacterium]